MNIDDLKKELKILNVPIDAYSLNGGLPNESYCMAHNNENWEIYYSERGKKSGLNVFENEDSACKYFLELMKNNNF